VYCTYLFCTLKCKSSLVIHPFMNNEHSIKLYSIRKNISFCRDQLFQKLDMLNISSLYLYSGSVQPFSYISMYSLFPCRLLKWSCTCSYLGVKGLICRSRTGLFARYGPQDDFKLKSCQLRSRDTFRVKITRFAAARIRTRGPPSRVASSITASRAHICL
jgi:hypothetical protein